MRTRLGEITIGKAIIALLFFLFFTPLFAEEKEIIFYYEEEDVNSYQAQAISFGMFDEIAQTIKSYLQVSHVPFMFDNKDSLISFLPNRTLNSLLEFKAISIDLNDDGIDEVIAYMSGPLACGMGGCTSFILQGKEKDWKILGRYFPSEQSLISSNKTNGYFDISYLSKDSSKKYSRKFKNESYKCE